MPKKVECNLWIVEVPQFVGEALNLQYSIGNKALNKILGSQGLPRRQVP